MEIKAKNKVKIAVTIVVMALFIVAMAISFYEKDRNEKMYIDSIYEKINSEEYVTYYNGCLVNDPSTVDLKMCHVEIDDDKKVVTLTPQRYFSY